MCGQKEVEFKILHQELAESSDVAFNSDSCCYEICNLVFALAVITTAIGLFLLPLRATFLVLLLLKVWEYKQQNRATLRATLRKSECCSYYHSRAANVLCCRE